MVSVELNYTVRMHSRLQLLIMSGQAMNKSRYICWEVHEGNVFIQWSEQQFLNFIWPSTSGEYYSPSGISLWSIFILTETLFWNPRALYPLIFQAVLLASYNRKSDTVQYWHGKLPNIYLAHACSQLKLWCHSMLLWGHACWNFVLFYDWRIDELIVFIWGLNTKCIQNLGMRMKE